MRYCPICDTPEGEIHAPGCVRVQSPDVCRNEINKISAAAHDTRSTCAGDQLIVKLEALKTQWIVEARTIETIYGENTPAAAALNKCVKDLCGVIYGDLDFATSVEQ